MRIILLLLAVSGVCGSSLAAGTDPRQRPPTGWDVRLAPTGEPGEPFELSGRVLGPAGPLPGVRVYAYHADAHGLYGQHFPRLAAVLRSGPRGEYRLRTVLPGSYGGYPGHVHFELRDAPWGVSFVNVFKRGATLSQGPYTVAERGSDGVWRARWDLRPAAAFNSGPGTAIDGMRARAGSDPGLRSDDAWAPPRRASTSADSLPRAAPDSSRQRVSRSGRP